MPIVELWCTEIYFRNNWASLTKIHLLYMKKGFLVTWRVKEGLKEEPIGWEFGVGDALSGIFSLKRLMSQLRAVEKVITKVRLEVSSFLLKVYFFRRKSCEL